MPFISHYCLSLPEIRRLRVTDTYSLHRVVYGLFPPERENMQESSGILFLDKGRCEKRKGLCEKAQSCEKERRILILSDRCPQKTEFGELTPRELEPNYLDFPAYRFEITINPVYRCNASRKIIPLRNREEVAEWFCKKASFWGFSVRKDSLQVANIMADTFCKADKTVTIGKATLTGFLDVTDKTAFSSSVCQGIGRARSFGCGLLQIAPTL